METLNSLPFPFFQICYIRVGLNDSNDENWNHLHRSIFPVDDSVNGNNRKTKIQPTDCSNEKKHNGGMELPREVRSHNKARTFVELHILPSWSECHRERDNSQDKQKGVSTPQNEQTKTAPPIKI